MRMSPAMQMWTPTTSMCCWPSCPGGAVAVPAGGSVQVTVTLTLDAAEKAYLDAHYPNGAYLQAFVYADAVADSEGVDGTCHSIPVLGFYGNWTDPSMFEIGSTQEQVSGNEIRTPYTGLEGINTLMVEYARDPGYTYCLGGNPVVADEIYMPQRNAINNQNGDRVYSGSVQPHPERGGQPHSGHQRHHRRSAAAGLSERILRCVLWRRYVL